MQELDHIIFQFPLPPAKKNSRQLRKPFSTSSTRKACNPAPRCRSSGCMPCHCTAPGKYNKAFQQPEKDSCDWGLCLSCRWKQFCHTWVSPKFVCLNLCLNLYIHIRSKLKKRWNHAVDQRQNNSTQALDTLETYRPHQQARFKTRSYYCFIFISCYAQNASLSHGKAQSLLILPNPNIRTQSQLEKLGGQTVHIATGAQAIVDTGLQTIPKINAKPDTKSIYFK